MSLTETHWSSGKGRPNALLKSASEDEVIASFLRAEVDSDRYGEKLRGLLAGDRRETGVLQHADLADDHENRYRRRLLD